MSVSSASGMVVMVDILLIFASERLVAVASIVVAVVIDRKRSCEALESRMVAFYCVIFTLEPRASS